MREYAVAPIYTSGVTLRHAGHRVFAQIALGEPSYPAKDAKKAQDVLLHDVEHGRQMRSLSKEGTTRQNFLRIFRFLRSGEA